MRSPLLRRCPVHTLLATLLAVALAATPSCRPREPEPPQGSLGGPCYPNGTCDGILECYLWTCVEPVPCFPMATQPCVCADQSTGIQTCDTDRQWSACVCSQCGDGVIDAGEVCDGANLGSATCQTQASAPFGSLTCNANCLSFDTSGCHTCGDGVVQAGEQCDGDSLGGQTCAGLGLGTGTLACTTDCTLDVSGCTLAPLAQALERCTLDTDCNGGLVCRTLTKGGTMRCVSPCTSTPQCPSGMRCLDDGSGSTYCLGSDIGKPCTQASQCNYACLVSNAYCTMSCVSGHDCPNGYGCMPVGTPPLNVCVRVEAYCDSGNTSACIAPAACDLSANMILGGCTTVCSTSADCPQRAIPQAPWTCDGGGICRRPPDVYGPLPGGYTPTEWHCDASQNPVVLCNDAQHMNFQQFTVPASPAVDCQSMYTTLGPSGDACVSSCRNQGGCAFGYACVAVGSVSGQRMGLCLPTGTTETGSPCTSNPQCVSGYCHNSVCSRDCTFDGLCPNGLTCTAGGTPNVEGLAFRRCE